MFETECDEILPAQTAGLLLPTECCSAFGMIRKFELPSVVALGILWLSVRRGQSIQAPGPSLGCDATGQSILR
jgi:hypothetical protein